MAEDLSLEEKKKKKKEKGLRTPPTGAGLLRFYEEETGGIQMSPTAVVLIASLFVITIIMMWVIAG